jgi:hypothetical protein
METHEAERNRRHLRALSAVNRQLQAQLETGVRAVAGGPAPDELLGAAEADRGGWSTLTVRRATDGNEWLEQLQIYGGGDPYLVRGTTKGVFLVEGMLRRQIKSGLLFAALARLLGEPSEVKDKAIDRWREGPPVEVMEGGTGPAFVVVGGRRLPIRGLPLPHLVGSQEMLLFPEGEELNIASSRGPTLGGRLSRGRKLVAREGPIKGSITLLRRMLARLRKPR